jgi:hypothetical protein
MAAKKTAKKTVKPAHKVHATLKSLLAAQAKGELPKGAKAHVLADKVVVWVKGADLLTLHTADFVAQSLKAHGVKVAPPAKL